MKNKLIDIICVCVVGAIFGGAAVFNLLQPNRPTVSESEKRTLAAMPAFSVESLADGSYFAGVSAFVSDTFIARDRLVGLSRRMDTLKGFDYAIDGADSFVLLGTASDAKQPDETEDSGTLDAFSAAFEALKNQQEQAKDDESAESGHWSDPAVLPGSEIGTETEPIPETEPVGIEPAETEHAETEAPETIPAETEPAETEPAETVPPETGPAETETPVTEPVETEPVETEPVETEPPAPVVTGLRLSRSEMNLTVGSGAVIYATVDTTDPNGATVRWSNSDKTVVTISLNPNGGIDVKALGAGTCTLTCTCGDEFRETCTVTVSEVTVNYTPPASDVNQSAEFLTSGLFIYGDGVYTQAYYSESGSSYYAQTAEYYAQLFGCRVSAVIAPVSAMVIDNPNVTSKIADQGVMLGKMKALFDPSVNFVDTYTPLYDHRTEYLFFKTDHHWTQRGAYYAYAAFANSVGFEPTPLSDFSHVIRNENYSGSMYSWTMDARVKNFSDEIEAFYPTKAHTMTVTNANGGTNVYDSSIVSVNQTYVTFIAGDNPYTVINVPSNPQDRNVLVLKDSFGNAFVPFLCEHYGNIIVADVRYTNMNLYDQLKDYGLTDIVFVNNIQAANSYSWSKMYMAAVGVNLP